MNAYINVRNFGPIEKAEIDLRPLTVFVGEGNTGKSYLAMLIYAIYQNFGGISQFPWADSISSYFSLAYRSPDLYFLSNKEGLEQEMLGILEKINTPGIPFKFSDLPQHVSTRSEYRLTDQNNFPNELRRCFGYRYVSQLMRSTGSQEEEEMNVSLTVGDKEQKFWDFVLGVSGSTGPLITGHINPDMILLEAKRKTEFGEVSDVEHLFRALRNDRWGTGSSYYLPAIRSGIMQNFDVIARAPIKLSTSTSTEILTEEFTIPGMVADFLKHIFQYKECSGLSSRIQRIAEQLESDLLEGKIEVDPATSYTSPECLYRPDHAEEPLRLMYSAAMVSELAPLVLYLRGIVRTGDLLIIEEPESHLHPGAQTKMAQTLARLVRAGVRVVITTHSNWLLQQIGNLIREGELQKQGEATNESADYLKAEEVGAWWFHKNKPVTELPFDLVEGIEPADYLDIAEDLYNRSAGLQNRIEQTKGKDAVESE